MLVRLLSYYRCFEPVVHNISVGSLRQRAQPERELREREVCLPILLHRGQRDVTPIIMTTKQHHYQG